MTNSTNVLDAKNTAVAKILRCWRDPRGTNFLEMIVREKDVRPFTAYHRACYTDGEPVAIFLIKSKLPLTKREREKALVLQGRTFLFSLVTQEGYFEFWYFS